MPFERSSLHCTVRVIPPVNPRPFAEQARRLCLESKEHHDRTWSCATCHLIEHRLTPIHMMKEFRTLLLNEGLTLHVRTIH